MLFSNRSLILILFTLCTLAPFYVRAENSSTNLVPKTNSDPEISIVELDIMSAPLTVEELKVEANGWLELVKAAARKVADAKVRIRRLQEKQTKTESNTDKLQDQLEESQVKSAHLDNKKKQSEAIAENLDNKKDLAMDELTNLRSKRKALIDRLNIVLERITQKIGLAENGKEKEEVLVYRRYITAVGGIKIYASDMESGFESIKGWILSSHGGMRWTINIANFFFIMLFFWILGRFLSRATRKALKFAGKQSKLLTDFLVGMSSRTMVIIGFIVALSALEVDIGPLLAVIGAAGFVVAFALQNTLSNFASGIMIMFYRPFDVDDVVEVASISGKVSSLNLVTTTITTFDNKRMVVPNNDIWGNIITNATASTERRVDLLFGVGYEDDIDLALQVLDEIVATHPLVLTDPAPVIRLHELADSSVNIICRPWVKTSDYWTVYWDITRSVKERFDERGLSIPFPQRDIHIYQEQKSDIRSMTKEKHKEITNGSNQMGLEQPTSNDD